MKTPEFHTEELPYWLQGTMILAEENPAGDDEPSGGGGSDDDDDDDDDDDLDQEDTSGLKSALQKEREARKALEKERKAEVAELKALRQAREDAEAADKTELERAQAQNEKLLQQVSGLAEGYATQAVNTAIAEAAKDANFEDVDDALLLVNRSKITFEQDADDPSQVEVDLTAVKKEVADLATRKPKLLSTSADDEQPTGSRGGKRQRKSDADEEAMRAAYPSLNR